MWTPPCDVSMLQLLGSLALWLRQGHQWLSHGGSTGYFEHLTSGVFRVSPNNLRIPAHLGGLGLCWPW